MLYSIALAFSVVAFSSRAVSRVPASDSPRPISSLDDLARIRLDSKAAYILTADIDASPTARWNDSGTDSTVLEGWRPFNFEGTLDGNGHKISHLTVRRANQDRVGLFSTLSPGLKSCGVFGSWKSGGIDSCASERIIRIRNLTIQFDTLIGRDRVGALAGEARNAETNQVSVNGFVRGQNMVGGMIGTAGPWVSLANSSSATNIVGQDDIGGVVGSLVHVKLDTCETSGHVVGRDRVGGAVGSAYGARILNISSTADVVGQDSVGGVLGLAIGSSRGTDLLTATTKARPQFQLLGREETPRDWKHEYVQYPKYPTTHLAPSEDDGGFPVDTRLSNSVYRGSLKGRRWCGGIRGGCRGVPLSLNRCINSGWLRGQSHVGGISGSSDDQGRHISLIQAGLVEGDSAAGLFGDAAVPIGDVVIASPQNERISCNDLFAGCDPENVTAAIGYGVINWTASVFPDGLWGYEGSARSRNLVRYLGCDREIWAPEDPQTALFPINAIGHHSYPSSGRHVNSVWKFETLIGDKHNSLWVPPIRVGALPQLPLKGCSSLSDIFMVLPPMDPEIRFRLRDTTAGYTIRSDSLCSTDSTVSHKDSVALEVSSKNAGTLLVLLRETQLNRDSSRTLQACPLWPAGMP
ncbi:MAG: hypothetical protein RL173_2435 [Fibrobacterota bacterium]